MLSMSEPFFVISGYSWVIGQALLLGVLAAVAFYQLAESLKRTRGLPSIVFLVLVGGLISGLLLCSLHWLQLLAVPPSRIDAAGMFLLSGALLLGVAGSAFTQWLLGQERLGHSKLTAGGLAMSGALIGVYALQWNGMGLKLLLPHEPYQGVLLGLCLVVAILTFSIALKLPTQPKSTSRKLQFLQRWLSPFTLGLALASLSLMGMAVSSFLTIPVPGMRGVLFPALGNTVIANLLLIETSILAMIGLSLTFYRVRCQQELEAQSRSIVSSNAIGMMLCDYDANFLCVNDAFLEIVGYERAELEDQLFSWLALTPPEFKDLDLKAIAQLKTLGIATDYEKQLIRKDGQRVEVLIAGLSRVADYDNTAIACVLDITEKKKALFGLRESEARFRQLADSNLIGVVFWNIYGSIYDANEVFLVMLGYTRADLQAGAINWRDVILPSDEVMQAAMVQKAIVGENVDPYETVFICRDGSFVDVQVGFAMLHGARDQGFSFVQDISVRKRAEAALLENYQRINLILEAIPHKVWTADANGRLNYCNQNLLQYAGLTILEMIENGWGIYLHAEDLEAINLRWETAVKTGKPYDIICRFKREDGQYRWHLSTAHPVFNQAGQLILWVGTNTDIHEMKLAQDRLLESEARFRLMAEQSPIMIWVTNEVGEITYVNQRLSDFMGFSPQGLLRDQLQLGVNSEDLEMAQQDWQQCLQQQQDLKSIFRQRRYDGEERWVTATGVPTYAANGEFVGFVGTLIDITEQKRVQGELEAEVISRTTELQESMALMHSIVESVPSMIFLKEAKELRFRLFNKAGRELIGFKGDEFLDKNDYDYFPKEQADFFIASDRETLMGNELVDISEEPLCDSKGEIHILHTKKVPILDKNGKPAYLLGISEDITEFKKTQDQIMNLNQKLQEQVQAISAAHKALESFSYSVSHDLRAPLRSIDGYSQVVLETYSGQLDDNGKRYLQRIREGSQQMAQLIDDMLNLSRISRSELKKERVNLSEIVRNIIQELHESEPDRQVDFIIKEGLMADVDRRLMQSVLQNLVGNAWKFTSLHPHAIIEFGKVDGPGDAIYFIRDDGAGFDMAYVDKLFGPFQRLHSATDFAGTGIGLASAQRIINRHGGEIWAQGKVDEGATFYFKLSSDEPITAF